MAWIIIFAIIIVTIIIYIKFFRLPSFNTINFIDGTNGVGKSEVCVYWSRRAKRREVLKYKICKQLHKVFKHKFYTDVEQPYLYSNLALRDTPFIRVTKEMLTRQNKRCSLNDVAKDTNININSLIKYNSNDEYLYNASFKNVYKLINYFDVTNSLFIN